jgi:hypothetical protein
LRPGESSSRDISSAPSIIRTHQPNWPEKIELLVEEAKVSLAEFGGKKPKTLRSTKCLKEAKLSANAC